MATSSTWVGGTDAEVEGTWKWAGGPEKGQIFFTVSPRVCYTYCNWNGGEPNNCCGGEHNMQIGFGSNGEVIMIVVIGIIIKSPL